MNETGQIVRKAPKIKKLSMAVPMRSVNKDSVEHKNGRWMDTINKKCQTSSHAEIPNSNMNKD